MKLEFSDDNVCIYLLVNNADESKQDKIWDEFKIFKSNIKEILNNKKIEGESTEQQIEYEVENNPEDPLETIESTHTPVYNGPPFKFIEPALVDKNGVEWNENLHAANKSIKKDGTWRLKKTAKTEVEQAHEDFSNAIQNFTEEEIIDSKNNRPTTFIPVAVPSPPPARPLDVVNSDDTITVKILIDKILKLTKANKITPVEVVELQKSVGISNLSELIDKPELAKVIYSLLDDKE